VADPLSLNVRGQSGYRADN